MDKTSEDGEARWGLRRVDGFELLLVAALHELIVDEQAQGLHPLLAVGCGEFNLHSDEASLRVASGRC